jgi:hypothetical protein
MRGDIIIKSLIMFTLEWKPEITIGDILTAISTIFAAAGLVFAGLQLRQNYLVQRAQFLLSITERYFEDSDVRKFYYQIDSGKFTLDLKTFIGSSEERWLDQLLYTFDTIGRMVRIGAIPIMEVQILAYQASRVLNNTHVHEYLQWLDATYSREGILNSSHADARFLVKSLSKENLRTRKSA